MPLANGGTHEANVGIVAVDQHEFGGGTCASLNQVSRNPLTNGGSEEVVSASVTGKGNSVGQALEMFD